MTFKSSLGMTLPGLGGGKRACMPYCETSDVRKLCEDPTFLQNKA